MRAYASGVSPSSMNFVWPTGMLLRRSTVSATSASSRTWLALSILGSSSAVTAGEMAVSMSRTASSSGRLIRTVMSAPLCAHVFAPPATRPRAASLSAGATESSRSRMTASAPRVWAFSTYFWTLTGTNIIERHTGSSLSSWSFTLGLLLEAGGAYAAPPGTPHRARTLRGVDERRRSTRSPQGGTRRGVADRRPPPRLPQGGALRGVDDRRPSTRSPQGGTLRGVDERRRSTRPPQGGTLRGVDERRPSTRSPQGGTLRGVDDRRRSTRSPQGRALRGVDDRRPSTRFPQGG